MLLLGDDLSLAAITPAAEAWLAEVAHVDWPSSLELPDAVERGGYPQGGIPRIRTASGRWLVLHAELAKEEPDMGFAQQYQPRMAAGRAPGSDGWFA